MTANQSNLKAALWMAGSLACMLAMTIAGRETTRELDVFQVMELRSALGLLMLYPLVRRNGGIAAMRSSFPIQHLGRNIVHYSAQGSWLYALTLIPLAQLIAIEFTAPIWAALLAMTFLGERMNLAKVAAIILGLVGVTIIVRPGAASIDLGQFVVLAAAFGFAISFVMVKSLTKVDSAVKIIFWMLVIQSVLGLLPALYVWRWPSLEVWPWLLVIAFSGSFAHYCMARAVSHADATVVMPMDFVRVPSTAFVGWLIYSEQVDSFSIIGTLLILGGNLLNLSGKPRAPIASETTS
jgi:drug/metabolite transporter (DMT)-like permease